MDFPAQLINYNEAATSAFLVAVREQHVQDTALLRLLSHTVITPHNWLVRIGVEEGMLDFFGIQPLEVLVRMNRRSHASLRILLRAMQEGVGPWHAQRPITYTNTHGHTFTQPLQDLLFHMLNHSTYHRGQLAQLLRQQGFIPPSTDFVYFNRT